MQESKKTIFAQPGVLVNTTGTPAPLGVTKVELVGKDKVVVTTAKDGVKTFSTELITASRNTDTIKFVSEDTGYLIRPTREADGIWLSSIHIELPVNVVDDIILRGDLTMEEHLIAYTIDDAPYVIALVFAYGGLTWLRVDGEWVQRSSNDDSLDADNIEGIIIDPLRAQEFIELYDENYVSISDASQFESATSDLDSIEDTEQSDD